MLIVLLFTKAY